MLAAVEHAQAQQRATQHIESGLRPRSPRAAAQPGIPQEQSATCAANAVQAVTASGRDVGALLSLRNKALAFVELSGGAVGGHDMHVEAVHACTQRALYLLRNISLACQGHHAMPASVPHVTLSLSCAASLKCKKLRGQGHLAEQAHGSANARVWDATKKRTPFRCQLACACQQR